MSVKSLPSLDDDLAPAKKFKPNLRDMRSPAVADEAVAANSQTLGVEWKAQTSLPPATAIKPILVSLRAEIPYYVDQAIAEAAFTRKVTKNFIVLESLKAAGFAVADADLIVDGRKARRRKT